jgi:predicted nucleic acid-binding protein
VVVALALIFAVRRSAKRRRTERLRERFGPEYERSVDHFGGQQAAEKELTSRERNRQKLDIVPLSPEVRERYAENWREVQTAFVDNPSSAVGQADRLVAQVMRERGYPIDDFDQRAADISVDHPHVADNYRTAHMIYLSQEKADIGTEAQREALVHYRALFEELLEPEEDRAKHGSEDVTNHRDEDTNRRYEGHSKETRA